MIEKLLMVGADIEIVELIENSEKYELAGIVDSRVKNPYFGYEIFGDDDYIIKYNEEHKQYKIIITLDDVSVKKELYSRYKNNGFTFSNLISNKAFISQRCTISEGALIQSGVNIGPNTKIGKCSKINTYSNVMHDVQIGSFSTIAPGTTVLGYCKIGNEVFIGGNVTVLPNVSIPDSCIVGAGAVVTKDLSTGKTYVGNPAKIINTTVK